MFKFQFWKIETPEGALLIETGWPKTEISMNGSRVSKRINSPAFGIPIVHEFESGGARYQVKHTATINFRNNLGHKYLVRRNGEVIADNPKRTGIIRRGLVLLLLFITLGLLVGVAFLLIAIQFGTLTPPD